jgi:lactoylglutathione lyase
MSKENARYADQTGGENNMQPKIALVTILTDDTPRLVAFYRDVLGFSVKNDSGEYVEFATDGVRFAVCARSTMAEATGDAGYTVPSSGHSFELAFPLATLNDVDSVYADIIRRGATAIKPPATMSWGQRTAFFADPDGNIHEIFVDLPA